ncbi:MAG: hypothetical protein IAC54_04930 [Bacteroidetes bacterium]|uniref:Uncharacterized protein n=1 Tax=Candidatus Caccoplasma merdipullorum TaxID=2840718 RepID=A0A9D9E4Y2_9BACT|nr:hypothetical protein [Candidatus Caccoplasma merdipullorum]
MKIKNLLFAAFLCSFVSVSAQDNLRLFLKDGSELIGYISRQRPGENFTFTTNSAIISLNNDNVKSIIDNNVKIKDLSKEWAQWAKDNNAIINSGDNAYLVLSNIVTNNGSINGVRILEKGVRVKYLEIKSNTYTLSWDTIEVIKADRRPKLQISGINRKYKLKSGMEYEGEYAGEVPGQTLSLYQNNGVIFVFNRDEVLKDNRYKINPNQELFEQSDLLDIVQLQSGNLVKGIIVERNYSDADTITSDYLLIQSENGNIQSIKLSDIIEYRKEPNPSYKPITDVKLSVGEYMINRNKVNTQKIKEIDNIVSINIDSINTIIQTKGSPTEITVETKFTDKAEVIQLKLVKIKKFNIKKEKKIINGVTYEDIVKDAIQQKKIETSINNITKITYQIKEKGVYALYNPANKEAIVFTIE